jgi:hypothetical protein
MPRNDLPRLRRLLIGLIGPDPDLDALAGLGEPEWNRLATLAAEHRLAPLLHARATDNETIGALAPGELLSRWSEAHRMSGLVALAQRADLLTTVDLLADGGIASVALKGAFLAWHAYPAAALRPLRDLDLLVPAASVSDAWHLLREAGYEAPDGEPTAADFELGKHLPILVAPNGSTIELHLRCWELPQVTLRTMPVPQDERLLAEAVPAAQGDPVRYPAPDDMLAHLAIHAAGQHLLDAGPLLLADVDFLLARHPIDWPAYWKAANAGGWARHTALALALVERWRRPGLVAVTNCPLGVPQALLDAAPDLLLQPLADRSATSFLAGLRRPDATLRAKLAAPHPGGFSRWLAARLARTARDLGDVETRQRARQAARLASWLVS